MQEEWWTSTDNNNTDKNINPGGQGKKVLVGTETRYYLRKGLNIIKVHASCKINIWPGVIGNLETEVIEGTRPATVPTVAQDTLIFSKLDIVKNDTINPKIKYRAQKSENVLSKILADIKKLDPEYNFYYNNKASLDYIIDLNDSDNEDTLDYVSTWFDYNNINNKFVISEIDTDYLIENVVIAKASRGNY
jgi:hypothetical protein